MPSSVTRRHGRAVVLITLGLAVVAVSVLHVLAPAAQSSAVTVRARAVPTAPVRAAQRPNGVLHIDNVFISAPEMQPFERNFIDALITNGFSVSRVDASEWDSRLDQAHADIVRTDLGDLTVIAPDEPGHPLWLCSRGIAAVNGADVPTYEVSAGGDRITVQMEGVVFFGRVGEVLVLTQQPAVWQQLSPMVSPVACPG